MISSSASCKQLEQQDRIQSKDDQSGDPREDFGEICVHETPHNFRIAGEKHQRNHREWQLKREADLR